MSNVATNLTEALDLTRKAVDKYPSRAELDSLKAIRAVAVAVGEYKKQVLELERQDRGITQQAARDLSEVMVRLPFFQHFLADKKLLSRLHTRQLAMEHIDNIQTQLDKMVKELEDGRQAEIRQWVKKHAVLSELHKFATRKKQPEDAYYLLFQQAESDSEPQLVTSKSKDGRVFTRWRLRDFLHASRIHQLFFDRAPIVGGAIIIASKLQASFGQLPQPGEGDDLLRHLLRISRDIASQPAREFVGSNPVLQSVHELCQSRELGKEAYLLLFLEPVAGAASAGVKEEPAAEIVAEQPAPEAAAEAAEESSPAEVADEATPEVTETAAPESTDTEPAVEAAEVGAPVADENVQAEPQSADEGVETSAPTQEHGHEPELLTRVTDDGKILTRYRANEFADPRVLYNTFGRGRTVCGAAAIEGNKLLHAFGRLPQPAEGESQLQALLRVSHDAVSKPSRDFLTDNAVLSKLHELSMSADAPQFADVVVCVENESGTLVVLPNLVDLRDFRSPRLVHEKYGAQKVVGASVIGDFKNERPARPAPGGGPGKDNKPDNFRRKPESDAEPRRVVVLALGRTPLKQTMLATPEIFARVGITPPVRRRHEGADRNLRDKEGGRGRAHGKRRPDKERSGGGNRRERKPAPAPGSDAATEEAGVAEPASGDSVSSDNAENLSDVQE